MATPDRASSQRRSPRGAALARMEMSLPGGGLVTVQCFPRSVALLDDIRRAWPADDAPPGDPEAHRSRLESDLRRWYPRLEVHAQTEAGSLGEYDRRWYVFRDGRIRTNDPARDRLHVALHDARRTTVRSDAAVRAAWSALEQASRPRHHGSRRADGPNP